MPRASLRTLFLSLSLLFGSHVPEVQAKKHQNAPTESHGGPQVDSNGYEINNVHIDPDSPSHHRDFYNFHTRADIDAPRWDIRVYNSEAVSPGYWFLAPYQDRLQKKRGGGWVGPHIYDSEGELIWSGVPEFHGFDSFDFRVANMRGENALSLVYRHQNTIVLDDHYKVQQRLNISDETAELNMHDFNIIGDGSRALMLKTITKLATAADSMSIGFTGDCKTRYYGFEEFNTTTWQPIFSWSAEGHIGLDESQIRSGKAEHMCTDRRGDGFDYLHSNAIDKFPDGDYLLNGRNTNAMYKISAKDKSVVWRFGGSKSDFLFDNHFSGQHHTRVRSQNETHTIVSFLDNANAPNQKPQFTNAYSRGMLVALRTDTQPMTAEVLEEYDHPHGDYAPGRGNYQVLPNGNTFIGWTSYSLHSEYDTEGNIVMEASLKAQLKSYRSYKFNWVGRPSQPPDVYSIGVVGLFDPVKTAVYVSWNGATEVKRWNFYKTNADGSVRELVASSARDGFETEMAYDGFASHVQIEAVDVDGKTLGWSKVTKSIPPLDELRPEVVKETQWLQDHPAGGEQMSADSSSGTWQVVQTASSFLGNPVFAFIGGIVCCIVAGLLGLGVWRLVSKRKGKALSWQGWRRKPTQKQDIVYEQLWTEKEADETEFDIGGESDLEGETEVEVSSIEKERERKGDQC